MKSGKEGGEVKAKIVMGRLHEERPGKEWERNGEHV